MKCFLQSSARLGGGGILGFVAGGAIKKLLKILAVIAGLFALALVYSGYTDIISANYEKLTEAI